MDPKIFSNHAFGSVEKWITWSVALKDAIATPGTIFSMPQEFQEIKKVRLLVKFELPNAATLVELIKGVAVDQKFTNKNFLSD